MKKSDYRAAIFCQDACNLSGVVHTFSEILSRLWDEARVKGKGTTYVNTHPISILFADKITSLAYGNSKNYSNTYSRAYDFCLEKGGMK